jgi:hypothetical protein
VGVASLSSEKPEMSDELANFIEAEIENNADQSIRETLDHVYGSWQQMPDDIVAEQCQYDGEELDDVKLSERIGEELDALIEKFGWDYPAGDLLPTPEYYKEQAAGKPEC